jgi:hypothetical protein
MPMVILSLPGHAHQSSSRVEIRDLTGSAILGCGRVAIRRFEKLPSASPVYVSRFHHRERFSEPWFGSQTVLWL